MELVKSLMPGWREGPRYPRTFNFFETRYLSVPFWLDGHYLYFHVDHQQASITMYDPYPQKSYHKKAESGAAALYCNPNGSGAQSSTLLRGTRASFKASFRCSPMACPAAFSCVLSLISSVSTGAPPRLLITMAWIIMRCGWPFLGC